LLAAADVKSHKFLSANGTENRSLKNQADRIHGGVVEILAMAGLAPAADSEAVEHLRAHGVHKEVKNFELLEKAAEAGTTWLKKVTRDLVIANKHGWACVESMEDDRDLNLDDESAKFMKSSLKAFDSYIVNVCAHVCSPTFRSA
jgi:hypothetical protein